MKKAKSKKELEDNWKRAVADYQNLKKRVEKEKEEFVKYANQRLLANLLPLYDALEKAAEHAGENNGATLIVKQLDGILVNEGVEKIEVDKGEKFDPETMEAVETEETKDEGRKDRVINVYRVGYKYRDRILRPAEVKVYA